MLTLFRDQKRVGVICVAAPERADAFGAQSLDLLRQLIPHLQRATQVALKMADLDALRGAGLEALDCLSEGVVLADANARVVFANRAAEAMLARADGIGVHASGLRAASSTQTTALRRLITLSARRENVAAAGGSLLLERPSGRRPLSVTVAAVRHETAWCPGVPPIAIVFAADLEQEQESNPSESRLRALYGMTPTEATFARLIAKGSGVKAAARALGIAPSTARTHLHRSSARLGREGKPSWHISSTRSHLFGRFKR
jgi:DNA-binding NarL/FixJ family response regulator